jgi:phenol/toluene 2-monooxygenase (NADH) P4/A4
MLPPRARGTEANMSVVAVRRYEFAPADGVEKFHGAQLLYIGWEDHLMFCAPFAFPLPPDMPFGAVVEQVIPGAFGAHPEFAKIDWSRAEWFKSGSPWKPDPAKSLAENGLKHKDVIRFRTPGLTGIGGSCA